MSMFLSIQALHEQGEAKKAIAKRLDLDVRTVSSRGAQAPGAGEAIRNHDT